jgi:uncharacterized membrane protein
MESILKNAVILLAVDIPWLYAVSGWAGSVVRAIQGSPLEFKLWPAIPVYLALGYLLQFAKTAGTAFTLGMATYAVYDFTNVATFKNYPVLFAVADSVWGGTLFSIAWYIRRHLIR